MKVILEGGIPAAAGYPAGAGTVSPPLQPGGSGILPAANASGPNEEDLEKKSREKVLEDLNQRFERRGGK